MGFKTFNAGDVLTASDVNAYLMKQAVIVCTSGTRPSSPVEGMVIFETDTNKLLVYDGTAWQFLAAPGMGAGSSGVNGAATTSGSDTTTSGTYVDLAGSGAQTSFSFTKYSTSSRIRVYLSATMFTTTATAMSMFGVRINSTDYDIVPILPTTVSSRLSNSAVRYISGVAAGAYTIQGRWKRTTGSGTLNRDTADWLSIEAMEVV